MLTLVQLCCLCVCVRFVRVCDAVVVPTKRTVLLRKELKLQPPAVILPSGVRSFSLDCRQ